MTTKTDQIEQLTRENDSLKLELSKVSNDLDRVTGEKVEIVAQRDEMSNLAAANLASVEFWKSEALKADESAKRAEEEANLLRDKFPRLDLMINVLSQQLDLLIGELRKANIERQKLLAELGREQ